MPTACHSTQLSSVQFALLDPIDDDPWCKPTVIRYSTSDMTWRRPVGSPEVVLPSSPGQPRGGSRPGRWVVRQAQSEHGVGVGRISNSRDIMQCVCMHACTSVVHRAWQRWDVQACNDAGVGCETHGHSCTVLICKAVAYCIPCSLREA